MPTATHRLRLPTPSPFELDVALRGHGWVGLAPHEHMRATGRLHTCVDLSALAGKGRPFVVDLALREPKPGTLALRVDARRKLERSELTSVRAAVRRMLALDLDLNAFWQRCAADPGLAWVARRGAGRMMASPTLFEDLLKLLFTTNCAWSNTVSMVSRTVEALGARGPSGRRAFPSAKRCAKQDEPFWREQARTGYRAPHCVALAEGFASGHLNEAMFNDPELPTAVIRKRLLALPGFGPYAAGQALRLLGRFEDLALDSWVRARVRQLHGLRTDKAIAAHYARFDTFAGLAMWLELTREWHEADDESVV